MGRGVGECVTVGIGVPVGSGEGVLVVVGVPLIAIDVAVNASDNCLFTAWLISKLFSRACTVALTILSGLL